MKYRLWLDHPESDCHQWASDSIHTDLQEAVREQEMMQDTTFNDGCAEYTVINLDTGYPYYVKPEQAESLGYIKRT